VASGHATRIDGAYLKSLFCSRAEIDDAAPTKGLGAISLEDFKELCATLDLEHTEDEVEKIFRCVCVSSNAVENPARPMNFHQFRKGVNRGGFLKHMARDPGKVAEFDVHPDFDLTKSTKEQYGNPDLTDFVGDFAEYRKKVDLEYHGNYTKERQLWQDTAVNSVVIRTVRQTQPWIVYTCGAMGCGKGFTMSWMSEHGIFPLENIVCARFAAASETHLW